MNWFLLAMKNTFDFSGRARRREFGWFMLVLWLIPFVLELLGMSAVALHLDILEIGLNIISVIFWIMMIIPSISVSIRRLHDLGYSGWWLFGWYIFLCFSIGLLWLIILAGGDKATITAIVSGILLLIGLISLIFNLFLYFKDGQKFPNKYGESPKYPIKTIEEDEKKAVLMS